MSPEPHLERRARVCLDLNVLVAAELATALGHTGTVPILLVDACRRGDFDLVISRAMLDRLIDVLMRRPLSLSFSLATERADSFAELAALSNLLVVGGGVAPIRDVEDRGVLEAALAGRAHCPATYNLADFESAARLNPDTGALFVRDLRILHPKDLAVALGMISPPQRR